MEKSKMPLLWYYSNDRNKQKQAGKIPRNEKLNLALHAYYMRARNFQHPQTVEFGLTMLHISKAPLLGF